jgi:hypothetical protein
MYSKQIKFPSDDKEHSKLYLWWIESDISDYYYNFIRLVQKPFYHAKKMYDWYVNVFKDDFDFDGHSLFAIIEYKLKRLEKNLQEGCAIQEEMDMKALSMAIKLAGRLKDDKYEECIHDRHAKKWGELKTWFEPTNDGTGSSWYRSSRPNAVTEQDKEQERLELRSLYATAESRRKREEKWLYSLLEQYLRRLWD